MESAIEMKRSNLVLPTSGYELDREEMCYVEGGLYISNSQIGDIFGVFKIPGVIGLLGGSISKFLASVAPVFGGKMAAIAGITAVVPVWGWIVAGVILSATVAMAALFATAFYKKQGVEITCAFKWFVPYPNIVIK
jgi:hypothetical protein